MNECQAHTREKSSTYQQSFTTSQSGAFSSFLTCLASNPARSSPQQTKKPDAAGTEGPKTREPSKYIRYIYNRIILENATVRAAAVSSLAHFGAALVGLRPRVVTLLTRAMSDNDDEVSHTKIFCNV